MNQKMEYNSATKLIASEIIKLPSKDQENNGFTCTGLCYDPITNSFYVGNAGKMRLDDETFEATIEQLSFDFGEILSSLECYKTFPNMRDIQGVALDNERTLWLCSYGENLIRNIDLEGNSIGEFSVNNPSGIAYAQYTDSLWILTDRELINYTKSGEIIDSYRVRKTGQDQLFIDEDANMIYFTAGTDYQGENYVYTFDITTEKVTLKYVLKDSYAIEGIAIIGNKMYILNDGYYHQAKVDVNQVNIYELI